MPIYSASILRSIKHAAAILIQSKKTPPVLRIYRIQREIGLTWSEGTEHSQLIYCIPLSRNRKKNITQWKMEKCVFWGVAFCFAWLLLS